MKQPRVRELVGHCAGVHRRPQHSLCRCSGHRQLQAASSLYILSTLHVGRKVQCWQPLHVMMADLGSPERMDSRTCICSWSAAVCSALSVLAFCDGWIRAWYRTSSATQLPTPAEKLWLHSAQGHVML